MALGEVDIRTPDGWITVKVVDPTDSRVQYRMVEVKTPDGWGCLPVVDPADADTPLEVNTPNGWKGIRKSLPARGGGGGGGGYSGPAGGDGTGVGTPGFAGNITTTKYAQADLGMDGSGGSPINSKLKSAAANNTEILFEPGTYQIAPNNGGKGIVFTGLTNFAIKGDGAVRDDVVFKHTNGKSGRLWNFGGSCDRIWWANFVIDHGAHGSYSEVDWTADGYLYAYNWAHRGGAAPENDHGGPGDPVGDSANIGFAMENTGEAIIENYETVHPPEKLVDYPNNGQGIYAGYGNQGEINLVNCRIEWKGEHACYASRSRGAVKVDGGRFVNNANTNMRLAGGGSFIRNAVVGITRSQASLNPADTNQIKSCRGLRVEAEYSKLGGKSGGYAENVDFVKTSSIDAASMLAEIHGSQGAFEFRNCRFRDESSDYSDTVAVRAIGDSSSVTPPTPHAVAIKGSAFTGGGDSAAVASARSSAPTELSNCCLGVAGGPGFTGAINESGTSYSGCDRASL